MKLYKIVNEIGLDFLTPQDQVTIHCKDGMVEWDEDHTSWWIKPDGSKEETINYGWVIVKAIEDGQLKEISYE